MSCSPGNEIKWADIYAISSRIDALAAAKATPDYARLGDVPNMPFKFSSTQPFNGSIVFSLQAGTTSVLSQYLGTGIGTTAQYNADPVLQAIAGDGDLYLVLENDDCWCKTIFKVNLVGSKLVLDKADEPMCGCQTLRVPNVFDLLDYGQNIIQAGFMKLYAENGNQNDGSMWTEVAACTKGGRATFRFEDPDGGAYLTHATRAIEGYFTWPIRKKYMDEMVTKFKHILACANSGGAERDKIRVYDPSNPSDVTYLQEGCEVTLCGLVADGKARGAISEFHPGCIWEGCCTPSECDTSPTNMPQLPWEVQTCGANMCDSKGIRVYCKTLIDFETLIAAAETGLRTYSPPDRVCVQCGCTFVIDCTSTYSYAEWCILEYPDGAGWVTAYTLIHGYEDEPFSGPSCFESNTYLRNTGVIDCNGYPCEDALIGAEDRHCQDNPENRYEPVGGTVFIVEETGEPPWATILSKAVDCLETPPDPDPGPGSGGAACSTSAETATQRTFGFNSAIATAQYGKYRVRLSGIWNCNVGVAPSTLEVSVTTTTDINGTVTSSTSSKTLSWNSIEQTYQSEWELIPMPDIPADVDVTTSVSTVVSLDQYKTHPCPSNCYQIG